MRSLVLAAIFCSVACSTHPGIGPDDASTSDVVTTDVTAPPDGGSPEASPDGSTGPGDPNQDGTRLKQIIVTGADGTKFVDSLMYDTQTGCLCFWSYNPSPTVLSSSWFCQPAPGTCADGGAASTWATGTVATF
jgi:hypothetical protein